MTNRNSPGEFLEFLAECEEAVSSTKTTNVVLAIAIRLYHAERNGISLSTAELKALPSIRSSTVERYMVFMENEGLIELVDLEPGSEKRWILATDVAAKLDLIFAPQSTVL